jgi:hypothetical protein
VVTLVEKSKDEILTSVASVLDEERGATFFFYYSGHGKVSDGGRLYLAASNTTERHLPANGVRFDSIIEMKDDFGCGRFCAVLDCCYAGLASDIMKGSKEDQLKSFVHGKGVFFLGAANSTTAAREEADLGHGVLTAAIIDGLSTGKADTNNRGRITGSDLFAWCRDFAAVRGAVRPIQVNKVEDDELVIAFSARRVSDEDIRRVRQTLTLCWENRMLPSSELDLLRTYFLEQEHVGLPKANSLENDFLEYAQTKLRFDELLERKAARRGAAVNTVSMQPTAGTNKPDRTPRIGAAEATMAVVPAVSVSQSSVRWDILAGFVCAVASGSMPGAVLFQSSQGDPFAPIGVITFGFLVCLSVGFLTGLMWWRIGLHKAAAIELGVTLFPSLIVTANGTHATDFVGSFFIFSAIPTVATYLAMASLRVIRS